jgi:hypothetical protein
MSKGLCTECTESSQIPWTNSLSHPESHSFHILSRKLMGFWILMPFLFPYQLYLCSFYLSTFINHSLCILKIIQKSLSNMVKFTLKIGK